MVGTTDREEPTRSQASPASARITAHNVLGSDQAQQPHPTMLKPISFQLKEAYGRVRAYPISQEAILLCRLTEAKTLLPGNIGTIAGLGYECVDQNGSIINPSDLY